MTSNITKIIFIVLFLLSFFTSCSDVEKREVKKPAPNDWEKRAVKDRSLDSLEVGLTYLSVYSEIYSNTIKEKILLGVTVSIRNPNETDTIFIERAEYFETNGTSIKKYVSNPVYVEPMETVEIVIDRLDRSGGSGANFMFDWKKKPDSFEPLFESVMIAATGNQGLSFASKGVRLK